MTDDVGFADQIDEEFVNDLVRMTRTAKDDNEARERVWMFFEGAGLVPRKEER